MAICPFALLGLTHSIIEELARYLPPNLQQLVQNPPNLSHPSSFLPLIRAILPYTQIIIVIVAVYIVWSFISGIFGFFARFARFGLKISPVIGLLGWLMANSGQGDMNSVMELAKQAMGLGQNGAGAAAGGFGQQAQSAGLAGLANLFGMGGNNNNNDNGYTKKAGAGTKRSTRSTTRNGAKAAPAGNANADIEAILKSATGAHPDDDWSDVIQRYVKGSVLKASGLDWLFGEKDETKRGSR